MPPSLERPLDGSCLCGGVRYRVTAPFGRINFCHCSRCRKHSGAAASVHGRVPGSGLELLSGADLLRTFQPPGGTPKTFCVACGASLFGAGWPDGEEVAIRFGTLDGDPGARPQFHGYVSSMAPWDVLPDDGLPRYEAGRPAG
ncbi:MAG TPA: GFA family protein [Solirubrobacteraceae bacterium]|nr:GFA family protein [Solirubrobacteraceae bacterium]